MNAKANFALRLAGVIVFILGLFGVAIGGLSPVLLGLTLWLGSTFF